MIFSQSMDVKLDNGDWKLVGSAPVSSVIEFPEYKVSTPVGWIVENHNGVKLRTASKDDLKELDTRKSFSPAALEYAAKAYWGLTEWRAFCDELISTR